MLNRQVIYFLNNRCYIIYEVFTMLIESKQVGLQIAALRAAKKLTQKELAERLVISFQAVSKWERGETMPDTAILGDLANVLETSIDHILTGGRIVANYKGKVRARKTREAFEAFALFGKELGKENMIYRAAIDGVNTRMNTDIEPALNGDDYLLEAFIAEALIQKISSGYYADITEIRNNFKHSHFSDIVCHFAARRGIK